MATARKNPTDLRRLALRPANLAIALLTLALAIASAAQATSMVMQRRAPETALSLNPAAGLARDQWIADELGRDVENQDDIEAKARSLQSDARRAFEDEPLAAKSLAILGMAAPDPASKQARLAAASAINRRELLVQGLVLDGEIGRDDYPAAVATLDRILRVHPNQSKTFFPLLLLTLADERTTPEMVRLVDGSATWHLQFLEYAAARPEGLPGLARFLLASKIRDPKVEGMVVSGLGGQQDYPLAAQLYRRSSGSAGGLGVGANDWRADMPPFDWRFADEPGLRAQPTVDGKGLEIYARSGRGGVAASRIVRFPASRAEIAVRMPPAAPASSGSMRLVLRCGNSGTSLAEVELAGADTRLPIPQTARSCPFPLLEITARALSGKPPLNATIDTLTVRPL